MFPALLNDEAPLPPSSPPPPPPPHAAVKDSAARSNAIEVGRVSLVAIFEDISILKISVYKQYDVSLYVAILLPGSS
jgi:hypothetical protein